MLIDEKTLFLKLTNTVEVDDVYFQYLLNVSERIIITYTKNPSLELELYRNEVVELSAHIFNVQQMNIKAIENGNVKALSNSGRSVTFMSSEEINAIVIPEHIKARLPRVKVRVW